MPLPGLYGVKSVSQRGTPAAVGVVRIPFTVNFASRTCAPWNARPGVPMGTSGGGRQIFRLYAPSAVAAPDVGFTYSGTASVCPATERLSIQTAAFVPGEHASVVCAAGLSVVTVPLSGSVRPVSRESAVASTLPIFVPAAWSTFAP